MAGTACASGTACAPIVVAEAVWRYSHPLLPVLRRHRGPILTVANWSGEWPGLVGMLNSNASLTKMRRPYSSIWSADLTDACADDDPSSQAASAPPPAASRVNRGTSRTATELTPMLSATEAIIAT